MLPLRTTVAGLCHTYSKMTRKERLERMLEKYREVEQKQRAEGRIEQADVLKAAIFRTESELEEELKKKR